MFGAKERREDNVKAVNALSEEEVQAQYAAADPAGVRHPDHF